MANLILTVLIGILGGLAVGVQGPIVSQMSQRIGTMAGAFVVHVSGAILSGALLLAPSVKISGIGAIFHGTCSSPEVSELFCI
jgi:uncharacterized membrane protein YdcZ (DUF606 family)